MNWISTLQHKYPSVSALHKTTSLRSRKINVSMCTWMRWVQPICSPDRLRPNLQSLWRALGLVCGMGVEKHASCLQWGWLNVIDLQDYIMEGFPRKLLHFYLKGQKEQRVKEPGMQADEKGMLKSSKPWLICADLKITMGVEVICVICCWTMCT